MGRINVKSVVLGGLLAGLIINISETILTCRCWERTWRPG